MKRMMIAVFMLAGLLASRPVSADQVIFVVRHAERAPSTAETPTMMGEDPPLSAAGEQRAARLAEMLAAAGVKHIFTTEYKRTRQTAAPLAGKLKLTPVMAAAKDPDRLVSEVKQAQGAVLIVGHSNTVPDLLKKFGVTEAVAIGDADYDNLFVVVRDAAGKATLVRLKF